MYMNSIGKHEDRIRNLYFIFAALAKAVTRAKPILEAYNYATDLNQELDLETF